MNETMKLCAAVMGGYALGRTKKGRKALSLAIWWASRKYGVQPRELIAQGVTRIAGSEAGQQLLDQIKGPLASAGKRAAMATLQGGVGSLTKNLGDRTSSLTEALGGSDEDEEPEESEKDTKRRTTSAARSRTRSATRSATGTAKKATGTAAARKTTSKASSKSAPKSAPKTAQKSTSRGGSRSSSGSSARSKSTAAKSSGSKSRSTRSSGAATRSRRSS